MYGDCDVLVGSNMGANVDPFMSQSSLLVAQRFLPQLPSNMQLQNQGIFSAQDGLSLAPPSGMPEGSQSQENIHLRNKEEEHESKSGSGHMEGGSGEEQDADQQVRKKRYHRHTARQIQEMEAMFKECPHPDDKQRQRLSIELGLKPRQVKFWFQNRRTQMKAQHDRQDNAILRIENENLRNENLTLREAVRNINCPSCGGPAVVGDLVYTDQHLRHENCRLKEELERVSVMASKYLGRMIPMLSSTVAPITTSSSLLSSALDLGMANFGKQALLQPPDILQSPLLTDINNTCVYMDLDKNLALDLGLRGTEELIQMIHTNEPLWTKPGNAMPEFLDLEEYNRLFGWVKPNNLRTEATRDSTVVIMNGIALVDAFMDVNKWMDMFPSIVTKAKTLQTISPGLAGHSFNGLLQLMSAELQVLSPLVSTREMLFLRYCQQRIDGSWVVLDFSLEGLQEKISPSLARHRRRPSGCLIQDQPNGYSKVTWVEHSEVEDRGLHRFYQQLVTSGMAFGAQRWLGTLQRQCERLASLMASNISARDLGAIPCAEGRRSMMKLAQRMTNIFCANITASTGLVAGVGDDSIKITTRKSVEPGQPKGVIMCAATSVWLPVPPQRVFDFLRDDQTRPQWDVLSSGNLAREVAHIANGCHPGNCISLLRINALNSSQSVDLILQESCTDASGSLIVYTPVDVPSIHTAMSGEDPSYIGLLPSGFAILPDGPVCNKSLLRASSLHDSVGNGGGNVLDSPCTGGSLLTVAFQVVGSNLPTAKLNAESVSTINNLICNTVQQVKSALNCADV